MENKNEIIVMAYMVDVGNLITFDENIICKNKSELKELRLKLEAEHGNRIYFTYKKKEYLTIKKL